MVIALTWCCVLLLLTLTFYEGLVSGWLTHRTLTLAILSLVAVLLHRIARTRA